MTNLKGSLIILIILFAFFSLIKGQIAPPKISLFTVQCKAGEGACYTQEIVRYDFKNGEFVSKETIFSLPTDGVRFDLGGNSIYQNRYIISTTGSIFDIQTKQLLGDNRGEVIEIVGNDVIIDENVTDSERFISFNLQTKEYQKLPRRNVFELGGKLSPNKKRYVSREFIKDGKSKFQFYDVVNWKGKRIATVKEYFNALCTLNCSTSMTIPYIWFDDERILTQKSNGEIISINVNGKIEEIVKIKIDKAPDSIPSFSKDEFGNIDYYINGETYSISVNDKSFEKNKSELGNNFYLIKNDFPIWTSYFFENKLIGKFRAFGGVTRNGFLATYYLEKNNNSGFYDGTQYWNEGGITIWNDIKKDWIKIEVDWGVKIIGWLEE